MLATGMGGKMGCEFLSARPFQGEDLCIFSWAVNSPCHPPREPRSMIMKVEAFPLFICNFPLPE